MSVPVQDPINQVVIVGGETLIPWTWNLQNENEIVVLKKIFATGLIVTLTLNADYTVEANDLDNNNGGNITPIGSESPVTAGDIWTLFRVTAVDRSPDFATSGAFFALTINEQLDELTRIAQDVSRDVVNAVRKDPGVGDTLNPLIPQPVDERSLKFRDTGGGNFEMVMSNNDPDEIADNAQASADAAAVSAANAAASEANAAASETNAAQSASDAADSAASINLPPILGGDVGKILVVNPAEDGYDLETLVIPEPIDQQARNDLALNTFNDMIDRADDRLNFENGFLDVFTDTSDLDNEAVSIQMIRFDGVNDYTNMVDTNLVDAQKYVISLLAKVRADGTTIQFIGSVGNRFEVVRDSSNRIQVHMRDSGGVDLVQVHSNATTLTVADGLTHILIGIDLTTPTLRILKNGVEASNTVTILTSGTDIDMTNGTLRVGANSATNIKMNGDLGQIYITNEHLDFSVASNVALFFDTTNSSPVDLGSNGSKPTGTQSMIMLNGVFAGSGWLVNAGSADNLTEVGELVDAGSLTTGAGDLIYNSTDDTVENADEIVDTYGKENADNQNGITTLTLDWVGQSFDTPAGGMVVTRIGIPFFESGTATGNLKVSISGHTGTFGTSSEPDNNIIAVSNLVAISAVTTTALPGNIVYFDFPEPVILAGSTQYTWFVDNIDGSRDNTNLIRVITDVSSPTHDGNFFTTDDEGATYSTDSSIDIIFYLYGIKTLKVVTVPTDDMVDSPSPASAPDRGYAQIILEEFPDDQDLDVDIIARMSRDGGANFNNAVLSRNRTQVDGTSMNILTGEIDMSGQPSGTNIVFELEGLNKNIVHGIAPNWIL